MQRRLMRMEIITQDPDILEFSGILQFWGAYPNTMQTRLLTSSFPWFTMSNALTQCRESRLLLSISLIWCGDECFRLSAVLGRGGRYYLRGIALPCIVAPSRNPDIWQITVRILI